MKYRIPISLLILPFTAGFVFASLDGPPGGPFHNRDNDNPKDTGEPGYSVPYQLPTKAEITADLLRVLGFLEKNAPTRLFEGKTGAPLTDFSKPVAAAVAIRGEQDFNPLAYEMGVVHAGALKAAVVTGDKRFAAFTERQLQFIHDRLPYFRAQEEQFKLEHANSFHRVLDPRALDDCGSMCAALIRAQLAHVGPDLKPVIDVWSDYILKKQFRLPDGTLARQRPQAQSLWADDLYMGVPALAEMGHLTGDRKWFDEAVKNALQTSSYLFNKQMGLYTHGWNSNNPDGPQFYWCRASGWAVVALSDLLDVLPKDHPGYQPVLTQLRAILRGVAQYQSGRGLWNQLMDRNDSYLETSASAMFVYGYAHAINQGWISPTTYGSIAQAGWNAITARINKAGGIEGTCVGTTYASDAVYYYHRPVSVYALHGYGPTLLAGAEMILLLENPKIDIQIKLRTYHYVPKDAGPISYREHD